MYTVIQKKNDNIEITIEKHIIILATLLVLNHLTWSISVHLNEAVEEVLKKADVILFLAEVGLVLSYFTVLFLDKGKRKKLANIIKKYFCKEQILLLLLCVWTFISILLSLFDDRISMIKDNIFSLYDLIVVTMVFFPLGKYYVNSKPSRILSFIGRFLVIAFSGLSFFILVTAFSSKIYDMGYLFPFGINENYQLCINCNPNVTGIYYAVSVLMCLWACLTINNKISKLLYGICGMLNFLILILSNSRGSFIGFSLGVCLVVEVKLFNKINGKNILLNIVLVCVIFVVTFCSLLLFRSVFFSLFDYITNFSKIMGNDTGNVERELNPMYSSGRTDIWKYSFRWIVDRPYNAIFGASPKGVNTAISLISNDEFNTYTHNQFLEVAVAIGLPGLIVYTVWLSIVAKKCVLLVMDNILTKYKNLIIPACIIFAIVIINLVEAYLLFDLNYVGIFFMLLCGYVSGKKETVIKEKNEKDSIVC